MPTHCKFKTVENYREARQASKCGLFKAVVYRIRFEVGVVELLRCEVHVD
jgi:hypothetical protein